MSFEILLFLYEQSVFVYYAEVHSVLRVSIHFTLKQKKNLPPKYESNFDF
jgi:hypothetical protein